MHAHQHTTAAYEGHAPNHAHSHALSNGGLAGASIEKWATVADLLALEARLMAYFGDAVVQVVGALTPPQVASQAALRSSFLEQPTSDPGTRYWGGANIAARTRRDDPADVASSAVEDPHGPPRGAVGGYIGLNRA